MLVGAAIGYVTTSRVAYYRTSSEIYVGTLAFGSNPSQLYVEPGLDQVELTYADMITEPVIAEKAVAETGVPRAAGTVAAETKAAVIADTNLIVVTVTDTDPVVATKIANGVADAFVASVQSYSPTATAGPGTVPSEPAEVFQGAGIPLRPLPTGLGRKVILGGVFGAVVAILLVLLLDYLDITIKSPDELERRLDLPVLGVVPLLSSSPETVAVAATPATVAAGPPRFQTRRPGGPSQAPGRDELTEFEEAFRIVRSNLSVVLTDMDRPTVLVTSANANEGKTLTCANLAVSFAAAGQRVVLVDLDLRHPNAHRLVGAHNEFGVSEVLLGRRTLDEAMQYVEVRSERSRRRPGLYFLGTGSQVADPAELLGGGRTSRLLDGLANQADLVLLDAPPVLPVADTLVIGRMASGAIMVTEARATAIAAVQKGKDLLIRNQTRLLGVVLNKFQHRDAGYGYGYGQGYGYGYGYGTVPEDDEGPEEADNANDPMVSSPNGSSIIQVSGGQESER